MSLPTDTYRPKVPVQGFNISGVGPGAPGNVLVNTARVDLYVSDINGNDANNGLAPATPVKTLAGALSKITFQVVAFDVVIHVGAHAGGTAYDWASIDGYLLIDRASIYVYGDGAGQPGEDGFTVVLGATAAAAASSATVIKGAFAVDAYRGRTVEILTGAAAGNRRTVRNNTATDLIPTVPFTAAVAQNDTYRIVRPYVLLQFTTTNVGDDGLICANIGAPQGPMDDVPTPQAQSMLYLVNLAMTTSGKRPDIINSAVCLVGCEVPSAGTFITASGEVAMGETSPSVLYAPALVVGGNAWHGWGFTRLSAASSFFMNGSAYWHGILVGPTTFLQGTCTFDFRGGHLRSASATEALGVTGGIGNSRPLLRIGGGATGATTGPVIENTSTGPGLRVDGPGGVAEIPLLTAAQPIVISSVGGPAVRCENFGQFYTAHQTGVFVTITGGTWGVLCLSGGKAGLSGNILLGITGATADNISVDDVIGYPAASLTVTAYSSIADATGTVIYRT